MSLFQKYLSIIFFILAINIGGISCKEYFFEPISSRENQNDNTKYIITEHLIDSTIPVSGFCFLVSDYPYSIGDAYKVYFRSSDVILFCDSVLNSLNTSKDPYNESYVYEALKQQAIREQDNSTYVGELAILLNRFHPLVKNVHSGKVVQFIVVETEIHPTVQYKNFYIRKSNGDSILVDRLIGKELEITEPKF